MSGGPGFYRGTTHEQTPYFANKEKKMIESKKWPPSFSEKVDITKVSLEVMKPWISKRITELLGVEDDIVIDYCMSQLKPDTTIGDAPPGEPFFIDPKKLQISLTGFMARNTGIFMKELWDLLLSAQENAGGVPLQFIEEKKEEIRRKQEEQLKYQQEFDRRNQLNESAEDIEAAVSVGGFHHSMRSITGSTTSEGFSATTEHIFANVEPLVGGFSAIQKPLNAEMKKEEKEEKEKPSLKVEEKTNNGKKKDADSHEGNDKSLSRSSSKSQSHSVDSRSSSRSPSSCGEKGSPRRRSERRSSSLRANEKSSRVSSRVYASGAAKSSGRGISSENSAEEDVYPKQSSGNRRRERDFSHGTHPPSSSRRYDSPARKRGVDSPYSRRNHRSLIERDRGSRRNRSRDRDEAGEAPSYNKRSPNNTYSGSMRIRGRGYRGEGSMGVDRSHQSRYHTGGRGNRYLSNGRYSGERYYRGGGGYDNRRSGREYYDNRESASLRGGAHHHEDVRDGRYERRSNTRRQANRSAAPPSRAEEDYRSRPTSDRYRRRDVSRSSSPQRVMRSDEQNTISAARPTLHKRPRHHESVEKKESIHRGDRDRERERNSSQLQASSESVSVASNSLTPDREVEKKSPLIAREDNIVISRKNGYSGRLRAWSRSSSASSKRYTKPEMRKRDSSPRRSEDVESAGCTKSSALQFAGRGGTSNSKDSQSLKRSPPALTEAIRGGGGGTRHEESSSSSSTSSSSNSLHRQANKRGDKISHSHQRNGVETSSASRSRSESDSDEGYKNNESERVESSRGGKRPREPKGSVKASQVPESLPEAVSEDSQLNKGGRHRSKSEEALRQKALGALKRRAA